MVKNVAETAECTFIPDIVDTAEILKVNFLMTGYADAFKILEAKTAYVDTTETLEVKNIERLAIHSFSFNHFKYLSDLTKWAGLKNKNTCFRVYS